MRLYNHYEGEIATIKVSENMEWGLYKLFKYINLGRNSDYLGKWKQAVRILHAIEIYKLGEK